jgi:SAM-dependent methyltransferase
MDRLRVPTSLKSVLRPLVWGAEDATAFLKGDLIPSRRLRSQVPGDFRDVGTEFLRYFRQFGGLRPEDSVLELGCGPGRMALPLTGYLSERGRYVGVDTWDAAVIWCRRRITPRHRNFKFQTIGTDGAWSAGSRLSFEEGSFDFAIVCSLARLDLDTYRAYVSEAGRLLRAGGALVANCYLLTPRGRSQKTGQIEHDPSRKIVLTKDDLGVLLSSAGLCIEEIYPGTWDHHPAPLSYQDFIVARKGPNKSDP